MIFGYARVSRQTQALDRQLDALEKYGVPAKNTYQEQITGTTPRRPQLTQLRAVLRSGDTLVIESLSRLGRSAKDLLSLVEEFENKEVVLISLKESIDMGSASGKLFISLLSSMSQFERDVIVQRTNEGLTAARARGRLGGRPKKNPKDIERALRLYDTKTHTIKEISAVTGVSQGTLYTAIRRREAAATVRL